ncbi:hypothetical protein Fmac_018327 [Flemingia macrophylla]|uniref:BPS1-like protein n=1 Tax=Flemingia macrophylla TaxID=520843 RepID=A0ABD1M4P7_9FABA
MVLLIQKLTKHYFKLENCQHPITHPQPGELQSSLLDFKSHVSKSIGQLASDLKPGSETLSLAWLQRCLGLLHFINEAFSRLVADIDYPMSKWEAGSSEGYLRYTLSLLELLNSISSCLSHIGQTRLSLAHGLTLGENSRKHLKAIQFQPGCFCFSTNFGEDLDEARVFSGKEWIFREALKEVSRIGFWVCGVLLSCFYGDSKPYMELRKIVGGFDGSLVAALDFKISDQLVQKMPIFSEIKDVNDVVAVLLVASDHGATKELQTKLQALEKLSDDISKEVDNLFANVMTQRSELVDGFRLQNHPQKSIV